MPSIFISLTADDAPLADALAKALRDLLGGNVDVAYSTSHEYGRGPQGGADWFRWIDDQVTTCDVAFVLLTPNSVYKPWIYWEAGAVAGAASATGKSFTEKVRPLLLQIHASQLPSPFRHSTTQHGLGDTKEGIGKVFKEMLEAYGRDADGAFDDIVGRYLDEVRAFFLRGASVPTDVAIEEWLARLDALVKQNRRSEIVYLQDWMEIAFGRQRRDDPDDPPRAIDLRIHTRLADIYLKMRDYGRAVEQLELARQLAPRDIYLLRTLGRAYLEEKDLANAELVISLITELDPQSLERNVECAALAARWHRESKAPRVAQAILSKALEKNDDSYYLANLLGEAYLESESFTEAQDAFREALTIVERLRENNIWANATGANSAFVLDEFDRALEFVRLIARAKPDADSLQTIERGLRTLAAHLPDGQRKVAALIAELNPGSGSANRGDVRAETPRTTSAP